MDLGHFKGLLWLHFWCQTGRLNTGGVPISFVLILWLPYVLFLETESILYQVIPFIVAVILKRDLQIKLGNSSKSTWG